MFLNKSLLNYLKLLTILFTLSAYGQNPYQIKELWVGRFEQTSPIKWQSKMELYLRYNSGQTPPTQIEGIITWIDLNQTKTKIQGFKDGNKLRFSEISCLSGDCQKLFLGGKYTAEIDLSYSEMNGRANLDSMGSLFSGKFKLRRVIAPE